MKALLTKGIVSIALMSSVAVAPAGATLIDRGLFDADGIPGGDTVRLVYDNDLNITWLGDANFAKTSSFDADGLMDWTTANAWASTLTVGGFNNWRLPTTLQPDISCSSQSGGQSSGNGCTGSEMGHLYNVEGITAATPGLLFSNVQAGNYWSGTEYALNTNNAWNFNFNHEVQYTGGKVIPLFAYAVHDGDLSAVPEPSTMILLSTGLAGLIAWRRKKAV